MMERNELKGRCWPRSTDAPRRSRRCSTSWPGSSAILSKAATTSAARQGGTHRAGGDPGTMPGSAAEYLRTSRIDVRRRPHRCVRSARGGLGLTAGRRDGPDAVAGSGGRGQRAGPFPTVRIRVRASHHAVGASQVRPHTMRGSRGDAQRLRARLEDCAREVHLGHQLEGRRTASGSSRRAHEGLDLGQAPAQPGQRLAAVWTSVATLPTMIEVFHRCPAVMHARARATAGFSQNSDRADGPLDSSPGPHRARSSHTRPPATSAARPAGRGDRGSSRPTPRPRPRGP